MPPASRAEHLRDDALDPARHLGAARREKVSSRMRRGSAPLTIRCATRCASVLVLPEPAPAMTSSGPATLAPCRDAVLDGAALLRIEAFESSARPTSPGAGRGWEFDRT